MYQPIHHLILKSPNWLIIAAAISIKFSLNLFYRNRRL
jgi:hypothetical protein